MCEYATTGRHRVENLQLGRLENKALRQPVGLARDGLNRQAALEPSRIIVFEEVISVILGYNIS